MALDLAALEAEIKRDPGSRRFGDLAREYQRLGRLEESRELCEKGLARYPNQWQARLLLTQIYLAKGQLEQAREAVERILMALPDHVAANHLAGDIYYALEDRARALKNYQIVELFEPGRSGVAEKIAQLSSAAPSVAADVASPSPPVAPAVAAKPPSSPVLDAAWQIPEAQIPPEVPTPAPEVSLPATSAVFTETPRGKEEPPEPHVEPQNLAGTIKMAAWGGASEQSAAVAAPDEPLFLEPAEVVDLEANETPLPAAPLEEKKIDSGGDSLVTSEAKPAKDEAASIETAPAPSSAGENLGGLNTTTLAELYARQGFPEKAIEIYQRVLLRDPDRGDVKQRVREMMRRLAGDAPDMPEVRQEDVRMALRQRRVRMLEGWLRRVRNERHV